MSSGRRDFNGMMSNKIAFLLPLFFLIRRERERERERERVLFNASSARVWAYGGWCCRSTIIPTGRDSCAVVTVMAVVAIMAMAVFMAVVMAVVAVIIVVAAVLGRCGRCTCLLWPSWLL